MRDDLTYGTTFAVLKFMAPLVPVPNKEPIEIFEY